METRIKEIFESIQGEGSIVGYKQLFIRFCACNLHCSYCDTDFSSEEATSYTSDNLVRYLTDNYNLKELHSVSLTGGEPLLSSIFLKDFLQKLKNVSDVKIYLETNATLYKNFDDVKQYVDIVAADIKLSSCSGENNFTSHRKFFEACKGIETFAKIVFDSNIADHEIDQCVELAKINNIALILQPKMVGNNFSVDSDFCINILNKFLAKYHDVRLIPQTHKFLNVQ